MSILLSDIDGDEANGVKAEEEEEEEEEGEGDGEEITKQGQGIYDPFSWMYQFFAPVFTSDDRSSPERRAGTPVKSDKSESPWDNMQDTSKNEKDNEGHDSSPGGTSINTNTSTNTNTNTDTDTNTNTSSKGRLSTASPADQADPFSHDVMRYLGVPYISTGIGYRIGVYRGTARRGVYCRGSASPLTHIFIPSFNTQYELTHQQHESHFTSVPQIP